MTTRTDQHRPSLFVPGDYTYVTSFDTQPTAGLSPFDLIDPEVQRYIEAQRAILRRYADLMTGDHRSISQCSVCGAHYRYAAVWRHRNGDHITTGEDCASTIDHAQGNAAMRDVRGLAKAAAAYGKLAQVRASFLASHPRAQEAIEYLYAEVAAIEARIVAFEAADPVPDLDDFSSQSAMRSRDNWFSRRDRAVGDRTGFIRSLHGAYRKYGHLTVNQLAAVIKSIDTAPERAAKRAQYAQQAAERAVQQAASQWVGEVGKREVLTATVRFTKDIESDYGIKTLYGMVDAAGNTLRYFSTGQFSAEVGEIVRFKGTVKAHETYQGEKQTLLSRCTVIATE